MVREKNVEKFHKYFVDLWTFLKKIYSDDQSTKKYLNKIYMKHHQMDKIVYMEQVLSNISPYIDYISKKDEFIFTPEFGNKQLNFILSYDFRKLWAKSDLTSEQKRIIFRYLEFLYIQASLALGKNQETVNKIVETIKAEQEIDRAVVANPNMFGDAQADMDFNTLFGNDNVLIDLAKDISQEFNIQDTFSSLLGNNFKPGQNPLEAIKNMSDNPEMREMFAKMTKRVTERMQEKNISQEDLLKSAETLKDNLSANVSKMPGGAHIRRMINNLNIDQLATQFAQNQTNSNQTNSDVVTVDQTQVDQTAVMQQMLSRLTQLQNTGNQDNLGNQNNPGIQGDNTQLPQELQQFMNQMSQINKK